MTNDHCFCIVLKTLQFPSFIVRVLCQSYGNDKDWPEITKLRESSPVVCLCTIRMLCAIKSSRHSSSCMRVEPVDWPCCIIAVHSLPEMLWFGHTHTHLHIGTPTHTHTCTHTHIHTRTHAHTHPLHTRTHTRTHTPLLTRTCHAASSSAKLKTTPLLQQISTRNYLCNWKRGMWHI